ncbi:hypothetical protein IVB57_32945 [Bradyrhizobium sp. CW9]|uniref:hypothetical protein n=1 Tax=Bradyrhizobium sp. CW9 TaxID=2782689 RepID=UPI001FF90AA6|nr:hypothetical protein [Bradyrhizobium sp. CW9]MCK1333027.1 hypothetical protein [Bradyrhizobium sp. CW9]
MTLLPKLIPAIDRRAFAIMRNTMPPRDPDDDEEEDDEEEEEEDKTDEPPVVREPDED